MLIFSEVMRGDFPEKRTETETPTRPTSRTQRQLKPRETNSDMCVLIDKEEAELSISFNINKTTSLLVHKTLCHS